MIIDPAKLDTQSVYKLLVGAVVPRPIAWVSTRSRDGVLNLAPYSFFTVVSREPPMLAISIGPRTGGEDYPKDTLTNMRESQEFVINMVSMSPPCSKRSSVPNRTSSSVDVSASRSRSIMSSRCSLFFAAMTRPTST